MPGESVKEGTYKGQPAVSAGGNLGLVRVDKDPGVASRTTTTVARYDTVVRPPYRLLVDEFDGRVWLWLLSTPKC